MRQIPSTPVLRVRTPAIGRMLLVALAAAAIYAVVLVATASAEVHRVQVTLVTGQVLTVTVDVPPGATVTPAQITALPAPIKSIVDLGPVATPTPIATPTVPPVNVPQVKVPNPAATPGNQHGGGGSKGSGANSGGGNGSTQDLPQADENPVNRADSNVRSGAGRAKDKAKDT